MLAVVLLIVTGALVYLATRLPHPVEIRRPGAAIGMLIVVLWVLSVVMFLVAVTAYVRALFQQVSHIDAPADPITPVTLLSGVLTCIVILYLGQGSGFWVAIGSAVAGAIAAPMIFEFPFDLIVMWRTYPPTPAALYILLFFLPLFLVEISSFGMVMLSPLIRVSNYTLIILATMFLVFAVWALFGFAYPLAPVPITLNVVSKVLAFAVAVSLFVPQGKITRSASLTRSAEKARAQAPYSSGLL